jgi:hypothetical protein
MPIISYTGLSTSFPPSIHMVAASRMKLEVARQEPKEKGYAVVWVWSMAITSRTWLSTFPTAKKIHVHALLKLRSFDKNKINKQKKTKFLCRLAYTHHLPRQALSSLSSTVYAFRCFLQGPLSPKNHEIRTQKKKKKKKEGVCRLLIEVQFHLHLHSLHSAESMSYACSLIVGYPTANFQWPMIALSLVLFKPCFVPTSPFALGFLSIYCSIPGFCLVPFCSCSHST